MKLSEKKLSVLRALATKKGRGKYGSFLASGVRVIDEAVKAALQIQYLAVARSELTVPGREFLDTLTRQDIFEISAKDMAQIDKAQTSQGIIAVMSTPQPRITPETLKSALILALDSISDPSNLGAILRSALAFGFGDILLSRDCAELYSPKVIRASAGAIFHLNVLTDSDLVEELQRLKSLHYAVYGTDRAGTDIEKLQTGNSKLCLVIGNEARGISPVVTAWCDKNIRIPMSDRCESLSAPVAAGIAMYEISKLAPINSNRRNIGRHKP
jgi:TrmH family RNA methyltransferase